MQLIHAPWFALIYPMMSLGAAFMVGRLTASTSTDIRDREYKAGWEAGRDAALLEMKAMAQAVVAEYNIPSEVTFQRTPAFMRNQAD